MIISNGMWYYSPYILASIPGGRDVDGMRAIRYHDAGDPSVLRVDELDRPTPDDDEVLVAVRAASLNPTGAKRRARGTGPLPKTTGSDFAGVVEAVGEDVADFSPGDRVCGTGLHTTRFQQGSFADYLAVPTDVVTHLPDAVSFEDGAAVALVGVTAWRALVDHAGIEPTESCLVHGGTGGVGHVAVQLADALCANVVATAGSTEHQQAARGFGADAVVPYDSDDLLGAVGAHVEDGFDVILDHRVSEYFTFDIEAAAFGGCIIQYGGVSGEVEIAGSGLHKNLTMQMMTMSNLSNREELPSVASVLARVLELVEEGVLAPEIARTYELEEASEVHRSLMEDSFVGKLVVTL